MKLHSDIKPLLEQALAAIESGSPESAAWRIADAGGLLRENLLTQGLSSAELIGVTMRTGRDFELPKRSMVAKLSEVSQ